MTTSAITDYRALAGEDCDSCGDLCPERACISCGDKLCRACATEHGCGGGIASDDDDPEDAPR